MTKYRIYDKDASIVPFTTDAKGLIRYANEYGEKPIVKNVKDAKALLKDRHGLLIMEL